MGEDCRTTEELIKDREGRTKYPVIHKGRTLCGVIINNEKFNEGTGMSKRDGSTMDVKRMTELLNAYGVEFNKKFNVTAKGMKDALSEMKEWDLDAYSGLIVVIMTHGGKGNTLCGSDGRQVELKDLAKIFNSAECEGLKNKPKMFIINSCRGKGEDVTVQREGSQPPAASHDDSKHEYY